MQCNTAYSNIHRSAYRIRNAQQEKHCGFLGLSCYWWLQLLTIGKTRIYHMAIASGDAVLLWSVERMHMLIAVPTQLLDFSIARLVLEQVDTNAKNQRKRPYSYLRD